MKLFTKQQYQQLIENASKEILPLRLSPVVKIVMSDSNATWLLTAIDPENTNIAYGLVKYDDSFSFLGTVNLNYKFEIDHSFIGEFPAEIYEAAEWHYGHLVYDKDILQSFTIEIIKPAQLSLF